MNNELELEPISYLIEAERLLSLANGIINKDNVGLLATRDPKDAALAINAALAYIDLYKVIVR
jgi:hypothetical protein